MTRSDMKQYCDRLVFEAYEKAKRPTNTIECRVASKEIFDEVWPWWNKLSSFRRQNILRGKQNPAKVYFYMEKFKKEEVEVINLPWYKRLWGKLCSLRSISMER